LTYELLDNIILLLQIYNSKINSLQRSRKVNNPEINRLDRKEFELLWEAAIKGDSLDRLIFVCAGHLGMRSSEIAHLKKDWIDFQGGTVEVPKRDGEFRANGSSRSIPFKYLRDRVTTELRRYFDYSRVVGVNRATIFRRVKNMAQRADLTRKVNPQALRSTCAFQLAEAGVNAQGLRQFMGWKELNTAQKYIEQVGVDAEKQIMRNKDKLW